MDIAERAVALRTAGAYEAEATRQFVALIPGVRRTVAADLDDETFLTTAASMWGRFFENTVVVLHVTPHLSSAMFYNPLLDVALVTRWEEADTFEVTDVRALAGERVADADAAVELGPPWMAADDPLGALQSKASDRFNAFARDDGWLHIDPPGITTLRYHAAARDLMLIQPRIAWNAARWYEAATEVPGVAQWLGNVLTQIRGVLGERDKSAIQSLTPNTDSGTAELLAGLDPTYRGTMVFDMILEEPDGRRTLIGSSATDGSFYVLAHCRLVADACAMEQLSVLAIEAPTGFREVMPGVWST